MSRYLFPPVSILTGLLAGMISSKVFGFIWGQFADEEAPSVEHHQVNWPQLLIAIVVEGAIFRLTRGLVDRGLRIGFERTTGSWPGEEKQDSR